MQAPPHFWVCKNISNMWFCRSYQKLSKGQQNTFILPDELWFISCVGRMPFPAGGNTCQASFSSTWQQSIRTTCAVQLFCFIHSTTLQWHFNICVKSQNRVWTGRLAWLRCGAGELKCLRAGERAKLMQILWSSIYTFWNQAPRPFYKVCFLGGLNFGFALRLGFLQV